jgi:hypothetical protein
MSGSAHSQDSALVVWDTAVAKSDLKNSELIGLAHIASVELKLMRFYLNLCQEFQPLPEDESQELAARLDDIGRNIVTYYESIAPEQLEEAGIVSPSPPEQNYMAQIEEVPSEFAATPKAQQAELCHGMRSEFKVLKPFRKPTK